MFDRLRRHVRHAVRGLVFRSAHAAVTILTLSIVVGAGGAVLAVANATLVRPLPFSEGERLVRLFTQPPGTSTVAERNPLHPLAFVRLRGALAGADALEGAYARAFAIGGESGEPESVAGAQVSAGFFTLLGRGPLLGRSWTEQEDRDRQRVVVISHGLWLRRFGGDRRIVGRTVAIDREDHTIVGVMPGDFEPGYIESELWTPLGLAEDHLPNPRATYVQTFARLRPGVTGQALDGEVRTAMATLVTATPALLRGWSAGVVSVREFQFGDSWPALFVLLLAAGALALIAAANLTNVAMADVARRGHELAVRVALGGSRRDLVEQQIVESLVLAAAGTAGAVALSTLGLPALLALDPQATRPLGDVRLDGRVIVASLVLATTIAATASVAAMMRELRADPARRFGPSRTTPGRSHASFRFGLVAVATAMAVVLLVVGSVLLNGFMHASRLDPGFDPRDVVSAQIRVSAVAYPTETARATFVRRLLEQVRAIPGVVSAGTTMNLFVPNMTYQTLVHIEGRPTSDGQPHTVLFRRTSPGYFGTMRIGRRAGRDFTEHDDAQTARVTIVSRSFVDRFWPNEDPIGRRVDRSGTWLTVVGVVDDVHDNGLLQPAGAVLYVPYAQNNVATAPVTLIVRSAADVTAVTKALRDAVRAVDAGLPLGRVATLDAFLATSLGPQRFRATLLLVLAGLGLALAAVGVYGVTTRAVAERTREVGVRVALGAHPWAVWRLIVFGALRAVGVGLALGIGASTVATMLLVRVLPDLGPPDAASIASACGTLALAAVVAAAWPASRAVAIDPVTALRAG